MDATRLPWALVAAGVAAEVPYPLLDGPARDAATVAAVVAFFLAVITHAAAWRGAGWALALLLAAGGGSLAVEAAGLRFGVPFGRYTYGSVPGPRLAGVPLLVPLAWTMMAYPALLAADRLAGVAAPPAPAAAPSAPGRIPAPAARRVALAAVGLAAWDLFLDPQMVAAGHWSWRSPGRALPGVPEVPLSNYLGWLGVSAMLMAALARLPVRPADDRPMHALYLWTWASSTLANLAFFRRPAVAAWGAAGMGTVALPLARGLRRRP